MPNLFEKLYEQLTGTPYRTVYRLSEHFREVPPVQVRHAAEIAQYSDAELNARGDEILRDLAARDRPAKGTHLVRTPTAGAVR